MSTKHPLLASLISHAAQQMSMPHYLSTSYTGLQHWVHTSNTGASPQLHSLEKGKCEKDVRVCVFSAAPTSSSSSAKVNQSVMTATIADTNTMIHRSGHTMVPSGTEPKDNAAMNRASQPQSHTELLLEELDSERNSSASFWQKT